MTYPNDFINKIICGDCLEVMKEIPNGSVDLVVTDPPYGITVCEWDKIPNLDKLWIELKKIGKNNCIYIFTASQPFTTDLINSNRIWFKYEWIWLKNRACNFQSVKYQPLKMHENICIFTKGKHFYNPIKETKIGSSLERAKYPFKKGIKKSEHFISNEKGFREFDKYPSSYLRFNNEVGLHPTQKPLNLLKYLIQTYSNMDDIILDPFLGSGTTAVACKELDRRFIGIEISPEYCKIAEKRLLNTQGRLL